MEPAKDIPSWVAPRALETPHQEETTLRLPRYLGRLADPVHISMPPCGQLGRRGDRVPWPSRPSSQLRRVSRCCVYCNHPADIEEGKHSS
jgi:hypothetical protein